MDAFLQFLATGVMVGAVYGLIALSIVLICKATGIFNFAIGQFVLVGAFIFWSLSVQLGIPIILSLILALLLAALVGYLVDRFTMRPLIGQPTIAAMMVTLALISLLNGVTVLIWGASMQVMPDFLPGSTVNLGNVALSHELLWAFGVAMVAFCAFVIFFKRTRLGLAMRSVAESHLVAQARGINVRLIFSITWALSAVMAALAGIFLGVRMGVAIPTGGVGLKAFSAVLFGGIESIPGAIIGGLSVGVLETVSGGLLDPWLMEITPYIIMIVVLMIRPEGLFGLKRIERI
ncbi:MAG: branched-chain amino acid ABC transporter permease [Dehalococcoidia bacterium]|nr:branched-chain amino acid ABC transporter permease [Dehalococcoidia bacterium]